MESLPLTESYFLRGICTAPVRGFRWSSNGLLISCRLWSCCGWQNQFGVGIVCSIEVRSSGCQFLESESRCLLQSVIEGWSYRPGRDRKNVGSDNLTTKVVDARQSVPPSEENQYWTFLVLDIPLLKIILGMDWLSGAEEEKENSKKDIFQSEDKERNASSGGSRKPERCLVDRRWVYELLQRTEPDFPGVSCTSGIVTGLSLSGLSLSGTLSSSIGSLTNLTSLSISMTRLNGQIPSTIGQLKSLTNLQLMNNMFGGPLPSSMGNLYNLQTLDLSYNYRLNGSIDVLQGCKNLKSIITGLNNFSGEIPPFVFNSSITSAQLGYNYFTYPSNVIFSSPSKLATLSIGGMGTLGNLPSYLYGNLTSVTTLFIHGNNITALQDSFASAFPNVTYLNLGYNLLTSIPSLVTMTSLIKVELVNNNNLRDITSVLVNLPQSITSLNLDSTNVNGTLDGMSSLLPNLNTLILNNVRLSGDLSGLTSLYKLTTLSMSNAFQGSTANRTLPASFGSLSQLTTVDLSGQSNNLIGGIPSSLSQLRNLNTLTLSYNYLNGSVPSFMNGSTFPSLRSIDLSNNQFTLIDKNALSGFTNTCSVIHNPFSCFSVKLFNSLCVMPTSVECSLDSLYSQDTLISLSDAQNILTNFTSSDQTIVIAAVMTALLRTTKTFSYTSDTTSISLQTYNLSVIGSVMIENKIEGQNSSVSLPASTVAEYNEVSVALSSVDATSLLSFYNQSIRGRVIGVQVYDGNGREVEIGGVTEKINITMGYIDIAYDRKAVCQWWNETLRVWSRDGCDLYIDKTRLAVCQCNHLTNFSIALDQNTPSVPTSNTRTVIIIAVCCAAGGLLLISVAAVLIYKHFGRQTYRAMEDIGMSTVTEAAVKYEEKIAESKESEVWKGRYRETTAVAVKKMKRTEVDKFKDECQLMKSWHHPHVVQYLGHNVEGDSDLRQRHFDSQALFFWLYSARGRERRQMDRERTRVECGRVAVGYGKQKILCFFFLSAVILPTASQSVDPSQTVDSLKDVWLTASGSTSYYRGQNPCNTTDFLGVTCTNGIVTGLSLTGQSLNGTLSPSIGSVTPSPSAKSIAGSLTNLTSLSVYSTQLNGQIPSTIGQLQSLTYLQLSHSMFSGPLPSSMGNLTNLQTLDLSYNYRLNRSIDVLKGCTNLTSIGTNLNSFSGEIPPFVFNSSITFAQLSYNNFTYPSNVIFSSPSKLTSLYLGGTMGNLPSYLYGNLTSVTTLSVDGNDITALQDSFASAFPSITNLNLAYNRLISIPSLVTMINLTKIELYNNYNIRNVTSLMINLPQSITYLNLDSTYVNGTLDGMSSLLPILVTLIMKNVRLSGDLSGLTSLYKLTTLSMSNAFQGSTANRTLPASFGSLSQLTSMDLSVRLSDTTSVLTEEGQSNNLVGGIPSSLSQVQALTTLNLRSNYLNGSIPSFMNVSTFPNLTSIDLSNNQFTLIEENALSGFTSTCSMINNPFSCFTAQPLNSNCSISVNTTCPLQLLYSAGTLISSSAAKDILKQFPSTDQTMVIAAVMTALLRTTKMFNYISDTASISLQTYNLSVIGSVMIENKIEGQNSSVSLPASTVADYNEVSVALSSVDSTSLLSFYNQSIRGRVVGVQVYDGNGREVEIGGVTEKINITMGYINDIPSDEKAVCQWWNETARVWSREGCDLYINEARLAVCQCNHLTNFSIALDQNASSAPTRTVIIIAVCCAAGGLLLISLAAVLIYKHFGRQRYRAMEDIGMSTVTEAAVKYEEKIAESKESEVWKGTYRETTAVAVKKMKRMEAKRFGEECQLMKSLHHPNVVQYLGHNMQGNLAEYARGQEMSVDSMLTIASDVSKGLSYIASMGKVHTAVIPSKIVITGHGIVTAKLSSFCCVVNEGTQAPEVEREGRWTESGHVWSVGVLLWAMASRRMDVYNKGMTDERVAGVIRDSVRERREERVSLSEMTRRMAPEEKKKNWETQPHQIDNVYVEKDNVSEVAESIARLQQDVSAFSSSHSIVQIQSFILQDSSKPLSNLSSQWTNRFT
ncbi:putative receptor-kinase [Planoprotostelium fungivorum]|uniref:Putative receptor-kinase n=1 Tax=Planoprotostelium fungivorum TaxID=1890364 RepID=A0A2P6NCK5_9EUKA|nr:putative receptor-kinase [Planoprotostelium fungivorum]